MNFLLLILQMVLGLICPAWRDSLLMAARADGRIEHHLQRPSLWERWLGKRSRQSQRPRGAALAVRAAATERQRVAGRGS